MKNKQNFIIYILLFISINLWAQVPNVPYFYQYSNSINPGGSCQNTSMAMLLKYYGATGITPDIISNDYGTSQAQTVSGFNTVCNAEAQSYGLTGSCVSTSTGTFSALQNLLSQGKPVVVHGYFTAYGHVMVILSYTGTEYICNDPAGEWSQQYQYGGYSGTNATEGIQIHYAASAFEDAIGPSGDIWYHYFNGTSPANPANLTATPLACPLNEIGFSWTNSGTNWHIDISTNSSFTNYWWKYVSNLTTYTGPSGFVDHIDGVTPLVFQPGNTYYWRITTPNGSFTGTPFTIHYCDVTAPSTAVSAPTSWITYDFNATFTDVDNLGGSGIEKGYYQVVDYNGSEWGANASQGYFTDDFNMLNSTLWTIPTSSGTWTVSAGNLTQSDETNDNTNIYTPLTQNLSNRYLYHFTAKAGGTTSTNRRFGFHYFCDDASLLNRGNSYFVWFRIEDQTLEFFKVTNNSFSSAQKVISDIVTVPEQFYDYKIIYDRITGKTEVYRDNILIGTWTDPSPLSSGNAISFRTGNAKLTVSDLNVYRSRAATKNITVGTPTADIRYQNPSPSIPSAKIKSIAADSAFNLSAIFTLNLNVDWTAPSCISVYDGSGNDADTTTSNSLLQANWTASADTQSGIARYWYAIGTSAGATDVVNWTNNNLNTSVTASGLSLISGQTYYFSVNAENAAGLSCISSSDGIYADISTNADVMENTENIYVYLNPADNILYFTLKNKAIVELFDMIGNLILTQNHNETHTQIDINNLPKGCYILKVSGSSFILTKKVVKV